MCVERERERRVAEASDVCSRIVYDMSDTTKYVTCWKKICEQLPLFFFKQRARARHLTHECYNNQVQASSFDREHRRRKRIALLAALAKISRVQLRKRSWAVVHYNEWMAVTSCHVSRPPFSPPSSVQTDSNLRLLNLQNPPNTKSLTHLNLRQICCCCCFF